MFGLLYWLYMQNYTLAFDHEVMRWTAHFWSLAIEEQFYFVWLLVALIVSRWCFIFMIFVFVVLVVGFCVGFMFKGENIGFF